MEKIKDKDVLKRMTTHGVNPDGWVNVDSMKKDWEFFRSKGQVKGTVTVDQVLDRTFIDLALKELGTYKARR